MKSRSFGAVLSVAGAVLLAGAQIFLAGVPNSNAQATSSQADNNIHAEVANALKKSEFQGIHISVSNGVVDIEGTVKNFETKEDADNACIESRRFERCVISFKSLEQARFPTKSFSSRLFKSCNTIASAMAMPSMRSASVCTTALSSWVAMPSGRSPRIPRFRSPAASPGHGCCQQHSGRPAFADGRSAPSAALPGHLRISVLNQYAIDPVQPIRIVVQNGTLSWRARSITRRTRTSPASARGAYRDLQRNQ